MDLLRMRWNSWIIQYDAESQSALARAGAAKFRLWRLDRHRLLVTLLLVLVATAALAVVAFFLPRRPRGGPLAERVSRFESLAALGGAAREPHEGPLAHAARFAQRAPSAAGAILRFGDLAASCRYGGRPADAPLIAELDALLARIRAGSPP
jgi:hypothetical protein